MGLQQRLQVQGKRHCHLAGYSGRPKLNMSVNSDKAKDLLAFSLSLLLVCFLEEVPSNGY